MGWTGGQQEIGFKHKQSIDQFQARGHIFQQTPTTCKGIKIKTGQTSRQPISTKTIMAHSVHTK